MKKILYTDFVSTEELIAEFLEKKEVKKAITRSNLYKFWGRAAGAKFAQKSKPYSVSGGTMVVACESPAVAQELMLKKTKLLVKLKPYLTSLKINISDIRFDTKKWQPEE